MFVVEFFGSKGWETSYVGDDLISALADFRIHSVEGDVRFSTRTENGIGGAFHGVDLFNVQSSYHPSSLKGGE